MRSSVRVERPSPPHLQSTTLYPPSSLDSATDVILTTGNMFLLSRSMVGPFKIKRNHNIAGYPATEARYVVADGVFSAALFLSRVTRFSSSFPGTFAWYQ